MGTSRNSSQYPGVPVTDEISQMSLISKLLSHISIIRHCFIQDTYSFVNNIHKFSNEN